MKKKKIKNPLIRRIPKELIGDWKKYLVVFLFLVLTIGFVSGMYVANESMITSANEGVTKYKQEDGHFELKKQADATLLSAIETGEKADFKAPKTTLYENFFRNEEEDYNNDGKRMARSAYLQRQRISTWHVCCREVFHRRRMKLPLTVCTPTMSE